MIQFAIRRVSETQYELSFTSTGEGLVIRYSREREIRWWLMEQLVDWGPDEMPPAGTPVAKPLDLLALLKAGQTVAPILPGESTAFKGWAYALSSTLIKVGDKWPGTNDGYGDALVHTWEPWPLPVPEEPDPEPETVVPMPHPFGVVVSQDGAGVLIAWTPLADTETEFRLGALGSAWASKHLSALATGVAGVDRTTFVQLTVPLVHGQGIEVQAQTIAASDARSLPSIPVFAVYEAAQPEPEPEPEPPPVPVPATNPIIQLDDGSQHELRRIGPWLKAPGWGLFQVWISKRVEE
jgi:hypothetical protein